MDGKDVILAKWNMNAVSVNHGITDFVTAPGSGATITMWDSGNWETASTGLSGYYWRGVQLKRLVWNGVASHDSGTNGLSFEETFDDGTNWDVLVQYTNTASTVYQRFVAVAAPRLRVRYTNSANVLTAWRGCLVGDFNERATQ